MQTCQRLYEILYVSTIAPGMPVTSVGDIARRSRGWNLAKGITGVLIFDGMRYCQQFEGPRAEVLPLLERIAQDARHVNMEILHHDSLCSRRFKSFVMGYTITDEVDALERFEKLEGDDAINAFVELASQVDFA